MKRMLLILVILLSCTVCKGEGLPTNVQPMNKDSEPSEIQIAREYDLIPDAFSGDFSGPVTFQSMTALAEKAVESFYGIQVEPDLSMLSKSADASSITRLEAAVILAQTTRAAWGEFPWPNGDLKKPAGSSFGISADDYQIRSASPSASTTMRLWPGVKLTLSSSSVIFAVQQHDRITGSPLLEVDQNYKFNPKAKLTQHEAILAALRLFRSFDPQENYVSLSDVPAHTIPKELYSGDSSLPEATNHNLPAWHGVLYFPRCWPIAEAFGLYADPIYRKSDFEIMRAAGLNLVCIYINPTRLGWPYRDDDVSKVNLAELEMLDQAIAWAFENDLHVQLALNGVPGVGRYDFGEAFDYSRLFSDDQTAQMLVDCWRMLARRYADIPNKYLGFGLMNEVEPSSDAEYIRVFGPAIDAIWQESPDRLIIADITSEQITGKSMAKKGVALSRHQYSLPLFDYPLSGEDGNGDGLMDLYPEYVKELTWPQLYLPSMLHARSNKITLRGVFSAGKLTIGINQIYDGIEVLGVRMDGKEVLAAPVEQNGTRNHWNMLRVNREYAVEIPEGTKKIEILNKAKTGIIVYNRLKITQNGKNDVILYPYDTSNIDWESKSATIKIGDDGSLSENRFLTWDDIKGMGNSIAYTRIKAMAKKYDVGFFVGEVGPFGSDGLPKVVFDGYLGMMIEGFQRDGVGWAHSQMVGPTSLLNTSSDGLPGWTYEKLANSPYYVNTFVMDVLRKYSAEK